MLPEEHTYSVLLVSSSEKINASLSELLSTKEYAEIRTVKSVAAARRKLTEISYDIVVINTPLPDDFGRRLAIDICTKENQSTAMLMVANDLYEEVFDRVSPYGVFVLGKPVSLGLLRQGFDWLKSYRERLRLLEKKVVSLEDRMADIRLVNRAKWQLIEKKGMSEEEAHRFIERLAMDRCIKKGEAAKQILEGGE